MPTARLSETTLLDRVLPTWHVRERHAVRVAVPPERALAAAREVTLAELPVVRTLFLLRGMRRPPGGSLVEAMRASGFEVRAEEPETEVVLGAVGQPWRARGGIRPDVDFASFGEPGYAKMALNFRATGNVLSTETRVLLTDANARRRFRLYWLAIRPFSALTRILWLRAAKRRTEHGRA